MPSPRSRLHDHFRVALESHFRPFDRNADWLSIRDSARGILLVYRAYWVSEGGLLGETMPRRSRSPDSHSRCDDQATYLELRWHPRAEELWVGYLQVAPGFRGRGLGSQLARATEAFAVSLELTAISVFPLAHAGEFWKRLGYQPSRRQNRVLFRELHEAISWRCRERDET